MERCFQWITQFILMDCNMKILATIFTQNLCQRNRNSSRLTFSILKNTDYRTTYFLFLATNLHTWITDLIENKTKSLSEQNVQTVCSSSTNVHCVNNCSNFMHNSTLIIKWKYYVSRRFVTRLREYNITCIIVRINTNHDRKSKLHSVFVLAYNIN